MLNFKVYLIKLQESLTEVDALKVKLEDMEWERDVFRDLVLAPLIKSASRVIRRNTKKQRKK